MVTMGRQVYLFAFDDGSVASFNFVTLLTIYLQRLGSPFTGSDTHRFSHLGYKDFAIADFSRLRRAQNGFHRSLRAIVRNHDLEFRFRKEIHRVLGSAINFTVPFLTAKSFYLTQSHSFYACRHQCFFHRLCLKWFDDRLDFFHRARLKPPAFQMASTGVPLECCSVRCPQRNPWRPARSMSLLIRRSSRSRERNRQVAAATAAIITFCGRISFPTQQ